MYLSFNNLVKEALMGLRLFNENCCNPFLFKVIILQVCQVWHQKNIELSSVEVGRVAHHCASTLVIHVAWRVVQSNLQFCTIKADVFSLILSGEEMFMNHFSPHDFEVMIDLVSVPSMLQLFLVSWGKMGQNQEAERKASLQKASSKLLRSE